MNILYYENLPSHSTFSFLKMIAVVIERGKSVDQRVDQDKNLRFESGGTVLVVSGEVKWRDYEDGPTGGIVRVPGGQVREEGHPNDEGGR